LLNVDPKYLSPTEPEIEIMGACFDMVIVSLGENPNRLKVGDSLNFSLKYMGALAIDELQLFQEVSRLNKHPDIGESGYWHCFGF
jgi:predicted amino acid racemase